MKIPWRNNIYAKGNDTRKKQNWVKKRREFMKRTWYFHIFLAVGVVFRLHPFITYRCTWHFHGRATATANDYSNRWETHLPNRKGGFMLCKHVYNTREIFFWMLSSSSRGNIPFFHQKNEDYFFFRGNLEFLMEFSRT